MMVFDEVHAALLEGLAQLDQVDAQLNMLMPAVATDAMAMQMIRALQALRGDDLDAKCAGGAAQLLRAHVGHEGRYCSRSAL